MDGAQRNYCSISLVTPQRSHGAGERSQSHHRAADSARIPIHKPLEINRTLSTDTHNGQNPKPTENNQCLTERNPRDYTPASDVIQISLANVENVRRQNLLTEQDKNRRTQTHDIQNAVDDHRPVASGHQRGNQNRINIQDNQVIFSHGRKRYYSGPSLSIQKQENFTDKQKRIQNNLKRHTNRDLRLNAVTQKQDSRAYDQISSFTAFQQEFDKRTAISCTNVPIQDLSKKSNTHSITSSDYNHTALKTIESLSSNNLIQNAFLSSGQSTSAKKNSSSNNKPSHSRPSASNVHDKPSENRVSRENQANNTKSNHNPNRTDPKQHINQHSTPNVNKGAKKLEKSKTLTSRIEKNNDNNTSLLIAVENFHSKTEPLTQRSNYKPSHERAQVRPTSLSDKVQLVTSAHISKIDNQKQNINENDTDGSSNPKANPDIYENLHKILKKLGTTIEIKDLPREDRLVCHEKINGKQLLSNVEKSSNLTENVETRIIQDSLNQNNKNKQLFYKGNDINNQENISKQNINLVGVPSLVNKNIMTKSSSPVRNDDNRHKSDEKSKQLFINQTNEIKNKGHRSSIQDRDQQQPSKRSCTSFKTKVTPNHDDGDTAMDSTPSGDNDDAIKRVKLSVPTSRLYQESNIRDSNIIEPSTSGYVKHMDVTSGIGDNNSNNLSIPDIVFQILNTTNDLLINDKNQKQQAQLVSTFFGNALTVKRVVKTSTQSDNFQQNQEHCNDMKNEVKSTTSKNSTRPTYLKSYLTRLVRESRVFDNNIGRQSTSGVVNDINNQKHTMIQSECSGHNLECSKESASKQPTSDIDTCTNKQTSNNITGKKQLSIDPGRDKYSAVTISRSLERNLADAQKYANNNVNNEKITSLQPKTLNQTKQQPNKTETSAFTVNKCDSAKVVIHSNSNINVRNTNNHANINNTSEPHIKSQDNLSDEIEMDKTVFNYIEMLTVAAETIINQNNDNRPIKKDDLRKRIMEVLLKLIAQKNKTDNEANQFSNTKKDSLKIDDIINKTILQQLKENNCTSSESEEKCLKRVRENLNQENGPERKKKKSVEQHQNNTNSTKHLSKELHELAYLNEEIEVIILPSDNCVPPNRKECSEHMQDVDSTDQSKNIKSKADSSTKEISVNKKTAVMQNTIKDVIEDIDSGSNSVTEVNLSVDTQPLGSIRIKNIVSLQKQTIYVFRCEECKSITDTFDEVVAHCQNHYNNIPDTDHCDICDTKCTNAYFKNHKNIHQRGSPDNLHYVPYSYTALFRNNWLNILDDLPKELSDEIQATTIYKPGRNIKMSVEKNGEPQLTLYKCAECLSCFEENDVQEHVRHKACWDTKPVTYRCPVTTCDLSFLTTTGRKQHKSMHNGTDDVTFRLVKFNSKEDETFDLNLTKAQSEKAQMEKEQKTVNIFKCHYECGLCYTTMEALAKHLPCNTDRKNRHLCAKCDCYFNVEEYILHLKSHDNDYKFNVKKNIVVESEPDIDKQELLDILVKMEMEGDMD